MSFALVVAVPVALSAGYMFGVAQDQFASTVSFSVRSEDVSAATSLLSGLSSLSGSSSSDTDVLYDFIRSQDMVRQVDDTMDLRAIYGRPAFDPVFAFDPQGTIEDLTDYWHRMVKVYYDRSTSLIELKVLAFDPQDARAVAQEVFSVASAMINDLSAIARDDATRYASDELERAADQLRAARVALTEFRSRNQIVDPTADLQGQMGIINSLQQQLTEAMISENMLRDTTRSDDDARIAQAERRIEVINRLLTDERAKFGVGVGGEAGTTGDYSALVGEFERLNVDREFAEQTYLAARSAHDLAVAEAQRKNRYLAAHVQPTLAESSRYPSRGLNVALIAGFLLLAWGTAVLVYYSIRDRR
ncbi:sugar transporter [Falsirhodobacter sp. 20TX0035]|uniref:sugar transporter n=1 Tax=Falsirhodobacter sp. 20TX0035 TaxID=3022019 RepID=UPI00232E906C|nr:sugar transporter [Falsirhodobacter sp. 20TX0035]MDB6452701.1 sugar transporter [Falsirhodobacter sp. 20TX0035]